MSKKMFSNLFSLRKSRSVSDIAWDGSSRRGRRADSEREEASVRDSSTHSALFDLELSHRGVQAAERDGILARLQAAQEETEPRDPSVHFPGGVLQRVIYLGRPLAEFELDLMQDLRAVRELCSDLDGLVLQKVAEELQYLGYEVLVRKNNPTDPAYQHRVDKSCLEKLSHSYIVCHGRQDGSVQHSCIVDPRFREQFQVGHPTPAYTSLLKAVPMEFVGSPLRLQALVNLLCGEIAAAYASQDLPLPPWRKSSAVLSKWFTPADMAVGAAVAAGTLGPNSSPPRVPPEGVSALPQLGLPSPPPPPQHHHSFRHRQPRQAPTPMQPEELVQALWEGMAASGSGGSNRSGSNRSGSNRSGSAGAGPSSSSAQQQQAAAAGPSRGMAFFEALSLHQTSLRQCQQQQQAPAPAADATAQYYDTGRRTSAGCSGGGTASGAIPDARLQDHTNRPRLRLWDQARQQAQQAQQQGFSLWGDEGGGGGPAERAGQDAGGATGGLQPNSWTDLSTILETRSAQSSPAVGSFADVAGAGGGPGVPTSHASSESAYTTASSQAHFARTATAFPTMPVSAYAGQAAARGAGGGEGSRKGGKRVVSLLARGLKNMGQKQTWASLLPNVSTVRRQGISREGSSKGGDRSGERSWRGDRSWRSGRDRSWGKASDNDTDGSIKHGRRGVGNGHLRPPVVPRHLPLP